MQKQPEIAVIAGATEAAFAASVAREIEFGRVFIDNTFRPAARWPVNRAAVGEHFGMADRVVVEEAE